MDAPIKFKSSTIISERSSVVRSYPRAIVLLCIVVSSTNPLLTPAVVYFIVLSVRSWSKCRYRRAYKYVNNAAWIAIVGMLVTMFVLVTVVAVFFIIPVNNKKTYISKSLVVNESLIPEMDVNETNSQHEKVNDTASASQLLVKTQEEANMKRIEENLNKTGYNIVDHFDDASFANIPGAEVTQKFINDTHVLIKDEGTGNEKLIRILVPKLLLRKDKAKAVNKSTT